MDVWKPRLFGLVEIDLTGIPRPERSGLVSVVLAFVMVGMFGAGSARDPDINCLFHPEKCEAQEPVSHRYHVIVLYKGGHGKSKTCMCHMDYRYNSGPVVHQEPIFGSSGTALVPACDNPDEGFLWWPERKWKTYTEIGGKWKMDFRLHCDDNKGDTDGVQGSKP